jgi:hypothetical protein
MNNLLNYKNGVSRLKCANTILCNPPVHPELIEGRADWKVIHFEGGTTITVRLRELCAGK